MNFRLMLNESVLQEGDLKSLNALFNDLSGLNFAKATRPSWLHKMSATESYATYLKIKAQEFGFSEWQGKLQIINPDGEILRVHLFDTHQELLSQHVQKSTKNKSA